MCWLCVAFHSIHASLSKRNIACKGNHFALQTQPQPMHVSIPTFDMKRIILMIGLALFSVAGKSAVGDEASPIRHRILFAEYGKGPNRLVEVSAEGNLIW